VFILCMRTTNKILWTYTVVSGAMIFDEGSLELSREQAYT